jgi:hypothetical protein
MLVLSVIQSDILMRALNDFVLLDELSNVVNWIVRSDIPSRCRYDNTASDGGEEQIEAAKSQTKPQAPPNTHR